MKVLHIITGLNHGGAESALYRLVTFHKIDTIENIVVSMTDRGFYFNELSIEGIRVFTLDMPRRSISVIGLFRLWKIIRYEKPDVVQTWMYHSDLIGGIVAKLSGVKKIIWGVVHYN